MSDTPFDTPFAVVDDSDPRLVRVTRPDGRSFALPRETAEGQGLQIRQPAPVTPERVPAPLAAAAQPYAGPTLGDALRSAPAQYDSAQVPTVPVPQRQRPRTGPAPTVDEVQASWLTPQAAPPRAATDATTQALRDASVRPSPRPAPTVDPALVPRIGPPAEDVSALDMGRNLEAQDGETWVGLPQAQTRPTVRRAAPAPVEDDKPFNENEQLIDQLIERGDGETLVRVGEEGPTRFTETDDMRTSSQLDRALYRLDDSRRLQQAAAEAQQAAAIDREALLERESAQRQQLEARRQQALGEAQRRYLDAYHTAQNATVNPSRFFADRGAAGTIGIAIATALGDLGGMFGDAGPNRAAQIIEAAINRDMEAQRANQANAQAGVRNARTFYDLTRQQFADEDAAMEAARSLAWNQVAQRTAAQMQGLASEEARINAEALRDRAAAESRQAASAAVIAEQDRQLALRREMLEQQGLQLDNQEQATENARLQRRLSGAGGGGIGRRPTIASMDAYNRLVDSGISPDDAARQLRIAAPPNGRFADEDDRLSAGDAAALRAVDAQLAHVASLIPPEGEDIPGFGLVDSHVPGWFAGPEARQLRQEVASLIEMYGRLHSGGAIGDEEFMLFHRIFGSGDFQTEEELRNGIRIFQREVDARGLRRRRPQVAGHSDSQIEAAPRGVRPRGGAGEGH